MPKAGSGLSLDGAGIPMWLTLELTYRCPLQCPWCNNPLDFDQYNKELTTAEWKKVLHDARKMGSLQLGFTGGEPMLRDDIEELVAEAEQLGFYTNLITSGIGLTPLRLAKLKEAGLKQIQLSIQHSKPEINDSLVGARAFDIKMEVAREIKRQGFPMVLNVPVFRQNIEDVEEILALAEEIKADYLEFANLQYYNWAFLNRDEFLPTREQIERAEAAINAARERLGKAMTIYFVIPDYYDDRPKACMNGWGTIHLTIAPDGCALPCQEARIIKGLEFPSVREHSLEWIWRESSIFQKYRGDEWMKEPCRSCDEKGKDFGGCRCQALLVTGDASNTDPVCSKSPQRALIDSAIEVTVDKKRFHMPIIMRKRGSVNTSFMDEQP
ncbi:MAG: pyrroloquinoline quinone biosynthesis protein PqqE [Gammaproteobacteria bacterium]|nr:pyrroloquinoline quinone biosynthesis protein PqqE [Gammaproteobacteria bacterium]